MCEIDRVIAFNDDLLRLSYVKCISYEASYAEKQPTRYKVRLCVYRTRVEYLQAVIEVCSVRASLSAVAPPEGGSFPPMGVRKDR